MAGLAAPNIRAGITEILSEPLSAINPDVRFDMSQGELVRRLKRGGLQSEPLNGDGSTFYIPSRPYYWRFLVPSETGLSSLETVSFGVPGMRSRLFDSDDAAFDYEQDVIDEQVQKYLDFPPGEAPFCRPLIADLALRASMDISPVFACIERRYPLRDGGSGKYAGGWSQLIFSSWLMKANGLCWKNTREERYAYVPRDIWEPGPSEREDIRRGARAVAMAALFATVPNEL